MILSLLGILLFMARRLHASLTNSLLLRFAHEESLCRAKEAAEAAERTKAAFLAMMSHELRTPLQLILGHAEILLSGADGSLADPQREQVEKVVQNACVLRDLITTVLDISRLEAGQLTVEMQEVSVATLLAQIRTEMQEWRKHAGVEVKREVGDGLPMLRTDGQKLKVVLTNLLSNAVKFTKAGRITVTARTEQDGVAFHVTDTGIGIPPEALTLIFEPFRQVENADTRAYGGSGLGLFIVQRLLVLLGGRIAVESEVRRGSTFHVWLPVGWGTPPG
jgi:signal transduction histidine kinase